VIAACERRNETQESSLFSVVIVGADIVALSSVAPEPGVRAPLDRLSYMGADRNRGAGKGIEVEGLVRTFKDIHAVDGIDISIAPGEIYGFLGPNGAGKSTTVHMLTTLLPPPPGGQPSRATTSCAKGRASARPSGRRCRRPRSTRS